MRWNIGVMECRSDEKIRIAVRDFTLLREVQKELKLR
jgi:hypothetical protein